MDKKTPRGVIIFAVVNTLILGLFPCVFSLGLLVFPSQTFYEILQVVNQNETILPQINAQQLKLVFFAQALLGAIFAVSGVGIWKKQDWGRKLTIYFSLAVLGIIMLVSLSSPGLLQRMFFNVAYAGLLIFYFTNKRVERYFRKRKLCAE
jgi:uncharacterized membrane protein (DUF2068 family)